jgi:hypothetical protein
MVGIPECRAGVVDSTGIRVGIPTDER